MKVAIVVGTRPEIIKMSSLIHECIKQNIPFILIHSNQHYSKDMDEIFFQDLKLPPPHYNLQIGSGKHGNQTGNILIKIEPIFESEQPDIVFVQGDTNTTAAAALAATKLNIKVAHIEAGLRSYDKMMPEETNRIMVDHLSDYLFAVSNVQKNNLISEGISSNKIFVVGNTVADALFSIIDNTNTDLLKELKLGKGEYALFTIHRAGNVDQKVNLESIIDILTSLKTEYPFPLIWPIHPRTLKKIEEYKLMLPNNVIQLPPQNYLNFLSLQKNAKIILTDSGGIQEEACILKVPCITLRDNTERPETIELGANILTGLNKSKITQAIDHYNKTNTKWENPFGEGTTAQKILKSVEISSISNINPICFSVTVIGLGYMGLPFSCLLAEAGHKVNGFDIDRNKVELIQQGKSPFEEAGMDNLLNRAIKSSNLNVGTEIKAADIFVISVPTPEKNKKCELGFIEQALESISKVVKDNDLVILESTVRPNTCTDLIKNYFEQINKKVKIAFCPERAVPGKTLYELVHNDRIIGGMDKEATDKAKQLYSSFVKGKIYCTQATVAETVKLMENTFRDVNIALANEFSSICKELKINVWEAIRLANLHPRVNILSPGPGVGGHCIAIDPWFLIEKSKSSRLIPLAREINEQRPLLITKYIISELDKLKGSKVGLLGVAYKKNIDDSRETPSKPIYDCLVDSNINVRFFDPYIPNWNSLKSAKSVTELEDWADLLILITDHDIFKNLNLKTPLIDTRGLINELTI
ncbi:MAG: UDP-N-acetylglucosamine 2-epimerase (non-hydrolyzing) [Bdellovibrionaceae bacterium]|nr:UDP-N-acetylglucosamine 2-epimerase (non-hydrolyzing) [Pseudobdellovibrionaceae bacterium]